jgi:hypothetical protein
VSETSEDWAAQLREIEARLDKLLLAPPSGSGEVFPPSDQPADVSAEHVRAVLRRRFGDDPALAIVNSMQLLSAVGIAIDHLRHSDPWSELIPSDPDRGDRLAVGAIRLLWEQIQAVRMLLVLWGDDIISVRQMRGFDCVLGAFPSATHAVLHLAEIVLAELWRLKDEDNPPPGPPYAAEDCQFALHGPLPPFNVDRWYAALPALRRHFQHLGDCWGLDGEPICWDTGLAQELAEFRLRWRAPAEQPPANPSGGAERHLARACRDYDWNQHMVLFPRLQWPLIEALRDGQRKSVAAVMEAVYGPDRDDEERALEQLVKRVNEKMAYHGIPYTIRSVDATLQLIPCPR